MNTINLLTALLITKADGLNLQKTIDTLRLLTAQAWSRQQKDFLHRVISLTDLSEAGAIRLTSGELSRIQSEAELMFGVNFREALRSGSVVLSRRAFNIGYQAAVNASLRLPNLEAINVLNDDFLFWVGRAYNESFSGDMTALMDNYFNSGATKAQLIDAFKEHFSATKNLTDSKWGLLADTNITRTAEIGHLSGYEDAGVEYAQIVAVLDDRTSDICRHLHGRKIPISAMARQRDGILDAAKRHDIEGIKRFQPMAHGESFLQITRTSDLIAEEGVGLPPYHFRCRTTTVAYSELGTYHEKVRQMAYDGEVSAQEAVKLVDYAKNAKWGTHELPWEIEHGGDGKLYPTERMHYLKHGRDVGVSTLEEYNKAIKSMLNSRHCDVFLTIKDKKAPYPKLFFRDSANGKLLIINIKGQNIASYYFMHEKKWRKSINKYNVFIKLRGGVIKWIIKHINI